MAKIQDIGFQILDHPAYSPDLAPSDFFLFGNLKKSLRGVQYGSDEEVIEAVEGYFESKNKSFYLAGIKDLKMKWGKCSSLKRECFE